MGYTPEWSCGISRVGGTRTWAEPGWYVGPARRAAGCALSPLPQVPVLPGSHRGPVGQGPMGFTARTSRTRYVGWLNTHVADVAPGCHGLIRPRSRGGAQVLAEAVGLVADPGSLADPYSRRQGKRRRWQ